MKSDNNYNSHFMEIKLIRISCHFAIYLEYPTPVCLKEDNNKINYMRVMCGFVKYYNKTKNIPT